MQTPSIAQTFTIPEAFPKGIWVPSINLFFSSMAVGESQPVIVEIIKTINGYPDPAAAPLASVVLPAKKITSSATTMIATRVPLNTLVYLAPKVEYAIKLTTNAKGYKVWTSMMGQFRVDVPTVQITQQPNLGSMFKSQNGSAWTPEQLQDMCFEINRAKFDIHAIGELAMIGKRLNPEFHLPPNPFKITNGSTKVVVHAPDHGFTVGMKVEFSESVATQFNAVFLVTGVLSTDTFQITTALAQTATDDVGGASVEFEKSIQYDTFCVEGFFESQDAGIKAAAVTTTSNGTREVSDIVPGEYLDLATIKYNHTSTNKDYLLAGKSAFELQVLLSSTDDCDSPVIDMDLVNATFIGNKINNPSPNDIDFDVDGEVIYTGTNPNYVAFTAPNIITLPLTAPFSHMKIGAYVKVVDSGGLNNNAVGYISSVNSATGVVTIVGTTIQTQATRLATLTQYDTYISEVAPVGGTAVSKYLTQVVNLKSKSTNFRVMFEGNIHTAAEIDMYYRISNGGSVDDLLWTQHPITYKKSTNEADFTEYEYNIPDLPKFDAFQFKFVFRSTTPAVSPKMKKLRIVATA